MPQVRLTDRFCAAIKADSQIDYFDEGHVGLALRVSRTAKTWTLHYSRPGGKRARLTLGRYPTLSLAGARSRALEAKGAIAEGRDPTPTGSGTLRAVVDEYFRREGAKLRSVVDRRSAFDRLVLPTLGDRPIGDIRRSEIVRLLDDIGDRSGPRAAGLVFAYLSKVFNWHASRDDDFRSPLVRGMGVRQAPGRDRILSDDELRSVWHGAQGTFGLYVRFLLLTAVRRSEAANMTRSEIVGSVWTIPAARMKAGAEHVVPLSTAALAVLNVLPSHSEVVFTADGVRPIGDFAHFKSKFDRAVPLERPWTLHDLRRTARSLLSRAGVSADVAERCLAHAIGGVRGVYDRHAYLEEKRQAFEALAALVLRIAGETQP
jgi:integrase